LHDHATRLAELVVECAERDVFSIAPAVHIEPIHEMALVESFPNQFLGSLIDESNLPVLNRDASDRYWEYLATSGGLEILLRTLLEPCRFEVLPGAIKDHDERAAVTCALTALAVAAESAVGVGDPRGWRHFPAADRSVGCFLLGVLPLDRISLAQER
jgi:hypothetical protein